MKFNEVKPGDPFIPNANMTNAIVGILNHDPQIFNENSQGLYLKAGEVLIINDSEVPLDLFTPVAITELASDPLEPASMLENQVYKVQKITEDNKNNPIGIITCELEAKEAGKAPLGKAIINGITPVKVVVSDVKHRYIDFDNSGCFISSESGRFQLLYPAIATAPEAQFLKINIGASGGGSDYNGYFKVVKTAASKIKIVDGLNAEAQNCAEIQVNKFKVSVASQELTVTSSAPNIYLESKLNGTPATSATSVFVALSQLPDFNPSKTYSLVSRVTFNNDEISDFTRENVPLHVYVIGDCE
jgi:hypothetical protein